MGKQRLMKIKCYCQKFRTFGTRLLYSFMRTKRVTFHYEDVYVMSTILSNYNIHKVLVGDGSVVNILSEDTMTQMGMDRSKLTLVSTSFIGIKGK